MSDEPCVHPICRKRLDVVTPIDGTIVGSIPAAGKFDVQKAIQAAKAAHRSGTWRKQGGSQRGSILRAIAAEVRICVHKGLSVPF